MSFHASPAMLCLAMLTVTLSSRFSSADESLELDSAVATLIEATEDAEGDVRYAAFSVLVRQPCTDAIVETLRRGMEDDHVNVRRTCLSRMLDFEGRTDEMMQRLVSLVDNPEMEDIARKGLTEIGEPAVPLLIEALNSAEKKVTVIALLGNMAVGKQRPIVVKELNSLTKDPAKRVRLAAIDALGNILIAAGRPDVSERYVRFAQGMIARYDTNKDGVLTEDEWQGMSRDPSLADQDQDGRITSKELAKWMTQSGRSR